MSLKFVSLSLKGLSSLPEHHQPHPDLVPAGRGEPEGLMEDCEEVALYGQQEVHLRQRGGGVHEPV